MYERVIVAQLEVTLAQGGPPAGTNYYFKRGVLEVLKCEVPRGTKVRSTLTEEAQ